MLDDKDLREIERLSDAGDEVPCMEWCFSGSSDPCDFLWTMQDGNLAICRYFDVGYFVRRTNSSQVICGPLSSLNAAKIAAEAMVQKSTKCLHSNEINMLRRCLQDVDRVVRDIDKEINGPAAASQSSVCDVHTMVRWLVSDLSTEKNQKQKFAECLRQIFVALKIIDFDTEPCGPELVLLSDDAIKYIKTLLGDFHADV